MIDQAKAEEDEEVFKDSANTIMHGHNFCFMPQATGLQQYSMG